jgi:hypothetical protein
MKNSIVEIALGSKFTASQIESVLEVIHATPNAEVAVEILLGIYEHPVLPLEPVNPQNFERTKRNIILYGYDKFTEMVSYKYLTMKTKSGWIKNGDDLDIANIASDSRWYENAADSLKIDQKVFKDLYTYHTIDLELEKDSEGNPKLYSGECDLHMWLDTAAKRK